MLVLNFESVEIGEECFVQLFDQHVMSLTFLKYLKESTKSGFNFLLIDFLNSFPRLLNNEGNPLRKKTLNALL